VYFNLKNILLKSGTFLLGHPIYDKGKKIIPKIYHDAERSTSSFVYTYNWMYTIVAK